MKTLYENKWCKIIQKDTFYILQSKSQKYNDQYFLTLSEVYKAIGIDMFNFNFNK